MKISILFVVFISAITHAYSQNIEVLKLRAELKVLDDCTDYNFIKTENEFKVNDIKMKCNVKILDSSQIENCVVFKIIPENCKCDYFIAYDKFFKLFYKLSGFKVSEFTTFFDVLLSGPSVYKPDNINVNNSEEVLNYIVKNIKIEGVNWEKWYRTYYRNCNNSLHDSKSCSGRKVIQLN